MDVHDAVPVGRTTCQCTRSPFGGLHHYSGRDLSSARDYDQVLQALLHRQGRLSGRYAEVASRHCIAWTCPPGTAARTCHGLPGDIIEALPHGFDYIARSSRLEGRSGSQRRPSRQRTSPLRCHGLTQPGAALLAPTTCWYSASAATQPNSDRAPHRTDRNTRGGRCPPNCCRTATGRAKQTENRFSHWIWRQYASAFWDDVQIGRVLPFRGVRTRRRSTCTPTPTRRDPSGICNCEF